MCIVLTNVLEIIKRRGCVVYGIHYYIEIERMKSRDFFKVFMGYSSVNFFQKVLDYLLTMGVIYFFTPEEYGRLSLSLVVIMSLMPFLGFSFEASASRYYYKFDDLDRKEFLGTAYTTSITITLSTCIVLLLFSQPLWTAMTPNLSFVPIVVVCILIASADYINRFYITIMQMKKDVKSYMSGYSLYMGLKIVLILLAIWRYETVEAYLYAYLISVILFLPYSWARMRKDIILCNKKKYRKLAFDYSVLVFPVSVFLAINVYMDRFIISKYLGNAETGIYSVASNLGLIIAFAVQMINVSIVPFFMESYEKSKVSFEKEMITVYTFAFYIVCYVAILLSTALPIVIHWLPVTYQSAIPLVPLFAFMGVMNMLYVAATNFMSLELNLMRYKLISLFLIVPINVFCSIFFLKSYGAIAPAISNLIFMGFIVISYMYIIYKVNKIKLPAYLVIVSISFAFALYILMQEILEYSYTLRILLFAAVLILGAFIIWRALRSLKTKLQE